MTTPTTPEQARELTLNLEASTLMGSSRAADYLRSLVDQLDAALQDRVALAMRVEALTAERDSYKKETFEAHRLTLQVQDERDTLRAEIDRLKQQEPVADEQSVFEYWLFQANPSGDAESIRMQWERSSDFVAWRLAAGAQPDTKELAELLSSRIEFAKYIARVNPLGSGDWACSRCRPNSDILKDGFVCVAHQAIDAAKAAS